MSSKRNEDRIPGPHVENVDTAPQSLNKLDIPIPTEFVEIPSQGQYYPEDHILYGQKTIEIKYMTAKEEDILNSKSLIKKGVAVDRFLQSIIIDKRIKVNELLTGDKNALIIAARISGYGSEYETNIVCPSCGKSFKFEFDLDKVELQEGDLKIVNGVLTERGTVMITLPKTKWQFEIRFLTGADEIWLAEYTKNKKKKKLPENPLTDQIKTFTVSIDGVEERDQISKAIDVLPAHDSRYVRAAYKKIIPNADLKQEIVCEECETEQEVSVPFTADFFWPDR